LRVDIGQRRFGCRIDVGDHDAIGTAQRPGEFRREITRTRIAVRLDRDDERTREGVTRRGDRRGA
jgi:hypothetical protein